MANTCAGTQSLQVGLTINQTTKEESTTNIINLNWILLDTCSTITSIRNKSLVQKIQPCDEGEELRAHTNGGHQDYDHIATLKHLPFEVFLMNNFFCKNNLLCHSDVKVLTMNWTRSSTYTFPMAQE